MAIVEVKNVDKSFLIPHEKHSTLKQSLINFANRSYEELKVLQDISLEVEDGEFFGIVGRNGSGKSTLLKLLAGIYQPTSGEIRIDGRLTPFIELGVGFNPELTGRDNIFLNGALLGLTKDEIADKYDTIVAFAELEKFMDQKLKNYSSGMQVRLAFSIAIQAHNEILLIDEVLAVGDQNFQTKCYEHFKEIKRKKRTVVFVSHDMDAVKNFCTRAVLIDKGKIVAAGRSSDVANKYLKLNLDAAQGELEETNKQRDDALDEMRWGNGAASIESIWTTLDGVKKDVFGPKEDIEVHVKISSKQDIENPVIGVLLQDAEGRAVFQSNTLEKEMVIESVKKGEVLEATFSIQNIYTDGAYSVSAGFASHDRSTVYSRVEEAHKFMVGGRSFKNSSAHPDHEISITRGR